MSDMTKEQIGLARHATGWPKCYRNRFVTTIGSRNFLAWGQMVSDGWAIRGVELGEDSMVFHVTEKGQQRLEEDRETVEEIERLRREIGSRDREIERLWAMLQDSETLCFGCLRRVSEKLDPESIEMT